MRLVERGDGVDVAEVGGQQWRRGSGPCGSGAGVDRVREGPAGVELDPDLLAPLAALFAEHAGEARAVGKLDHVVIPVTAVSDVPYSA